MRNVSVLHEIAATCHLLRFFGPKVARNGPQKEVFQVLSKVTAWNFLFFA